MLHKRTGSIYLFLALALPITCRAQQHPAALTFEQVQIGETLISIGMQAEKTALDCSHFVSSVFDKAGFSYKYEPSRTLYRGTLGFKRVYRPAEGDLIVWPGHVGIVVDPTEKTFLSKLARGVRVSSYTSRYWRGRGHPRFFRYALPISNSTWVARNSRSASPLNSGNTYQSLSDVEGVR